MAGAPRRLDRIDEGEDVGHPEEVRQQQDQKDHQNGGDQDDDDPLPRGLLT